MLEPEDVAAQIREMRPSQIMSFELTSLIYSFEAQVRNKVAEECPPECALIADLRASIAIANDETLGYTERNFYQRRVGELRERIANSIAEAAQGTSSD